MVDRSSVPDGVTFTYPQHPVPVEGDIDIPSDSTDALVFFRIHQDRRCCVSLLFSEVVKCDDAMRSPGRRLRRRGSGVAHA